MTARSNHDSAESTGIIGDALARWLELVLRAPLLTIFAVIALAAVSIWYAAGNLRVNTDTANMIDATLPWRQDFIEFRDGFPARDRNLIVVIDAASPAAADAFGERLAAGLRERPELYRSVFMAGEGEFFARNGLLFTPLPELEDFADRLAEAQPLLGVLERRVDGAAVLELAGRAATGANASGPSADGPATAAFDTELAATLSAAARGERRPVDWRTLVSGADTRGNRRLVLLQPLLEFGRMQPAAAAISGIREMVVELSQGLDEPPTVRLTGSVAMEHEELASVSRGTAGGGLATFMLVALVLYASFGSWRLLAISLTTLAVGLTLTAAFATFAVGQLNLLSIAFVVLNVGLGSDYVIHMLLRHKELVAQGVESLAALRETMRDVGASLALCAVTAAVGFYAFIPTDFDGVSELGLIAGTGVLLSLFASVTLLPALIVVLGLRDPGHAARSLISARPLVWLAARPRPVLTITAAIAIASIASLPFVQFDNNPLNLRDPESESVATLRELSASGDAELLRLAAIAPDDATAVRWTEQLRALPEVREVLTVDALVPGEQEQKLEVLDDLSLVLGSGLDAADYTAAEPETVLAALTTLADGADGNGLAAARAASDLLGTLGAAPAEERLQRLEALDADLAAGLPRELGRLAGSLTAQRFDAADLPEPLAERWVAADGRKLVEIAPAEDVSDNRAAKRFTAAVRSVVPGATGLPVVYQEASRTVVGAFRQALGYALVIVLVIAWLFLRNWRDTLLVIVPILLAAGVTAGATVWLDQPLNYANIITLPLLVGIGVDNGIHVVHRLRSVRNAAELFETSTMRAVLTTGLTTVASFGTLAFSAHVGTASMGVLLALGLAASMAATLIALPAWLMLRAKPG